MPIIASVVTCLVLLAGMLALAELGLRLGRRVRASDGAAEAGPIEGAIFALLGLLLGFAFAGAMARLDERRELVVHEANAIGTAYLRIDLLPPEDQPPLRALFRTYLDARLGIYDAIDFGADPAPAIKEAGRLQGDIWDAAVASSLKTPESPVAALVISAINDMIDVTAARAVALHTHMPAAILALLLGVALISAFVAGYAMKKAGRWHFFYAAIYSIAVSLTIYTVLDVDNPRAGIIRLQAADQALRELQESIR